MALLRYLGRFDAHHRQAIALLLAVLFFAGADFFWDNAVRWVGTWNVYVAALLLLGWSALLTVHPEKAQQTAKLQDSSRTLLFFLLLLACGLSLLSIIYLLSEEKSHGAHTSQILLSLFSIVESWFLIHTVFALHYAHVYYRNETDDETEGAGGGLTFPGDEKPDYLDFVYYSFVLGMTFQVSDVQITAKSMRHLALLHGLLSFIFNTAILALSFNVISSLFTA
jgi:uncharacterized membrane protein